MKIIARSNFDNESVSDLLIAENVSPNYDKIITNFLNQCVDDNSRYVFRLVPDDYKLYKFEP